MILRLAEKCELSMIAQMYASMVGRPGCVWNENYPILEDAEIDLACGGLYVLEDNGAVVGAVSVLGENELEELDCWQICDGNHREIVRVVIAAEQQGKGLAKIMLSLLFDELKKQGATSIRLVVAEANPAARKTYEALGFDFYGRVFMFDHDYLPAEKRL